MGCQPSPYRSESPLTHFRHPVVQPASRLDMDNFSPSEFSQEPSQYSSMPTSSRTDSSILENDAPTESFATGDSSYVPRPKRIACVVCRRRKLRCDGKRPSCGTCSRLGHECAYDEVRKKSGPKRGYVKQLEARLGMRLHSSRLLRPLRGFWDNR